MATNHNITATGRKDEGKGASRRLRRSGHVPAIVYGGHAEPQSVQVEHNHLWLISQNDVVLLRHPRPERRRQGPEGPAA